MVSPLRSAVALLLAVAAAPLEGQSPPNLSGTWTLQVAESDLGPIPAPDSRVDVIEHQEPRITIRRSVVSQGQETSTELRYAVDGERHVNTAGGLEMGSRLSWNGATLTMISSAQTPQGEVGLVDVFTLSEDGQTLTQARTLTIGGQELRQRLVLKKQ
ncbi:MAG: hypothetical protein ABR551_04655 [Gemmatimonadales bacterium]